MANEIAKTETRALTGTLKVQADLLAELNVSSEESGVTFSEYGKKCVINAIGGLVAMAKANGIEFNQIDGSLLKLALQNIGLTELNYSAMPSEIYFDLRKAYKKDTKQLYYIPSIKPQGAGNEKLLRKYGVGLVKDIGLKSAWLVREGDEFTFPAFDGLKMTPPKWTPKSFDKKVIMVVYPAQKIDGTAEYLIATREGIKPNIIAQIRQNTLYEFKDYNTKEVDEKKRNAFYDELNKFAEEHTVDELLANQEYSKYINPTYTSGGSKEQMILRKMKNNALKNYPKEYDNAAMRDAIENMWEDKDESVIQKPKAEKDVVAKVENEIAETPKEGAIHDFTVDEDGVVEEPTPVETNTPIPTAEEPVKAEVVEEEDYGI